jgi:hypothetical protein
LWSFPRYTEALDQAVRDVRQYKLSSAEFMVPKVLYLKILGAASFSVGAIANFFRDTL